MAMNDAQKLAFVHKMTHLGLSHLQHFDAGGTVLGGPTAAGTPNSVGPANQGVAGAVGSVLGTNNNFQAGAANITPGTNVGQLNNAYQGAEGALDRTTNLGGALEGQAYQGAGTQSNLTNQLQAESEGRGPNPAQAALNQNTGNNIANAAAVAAGVRGAGSNPGLIASNAANTAAATNQNATGQAATLEAQQQLAAQNLLQSLAGAQIGQGQNAVQTENQAQQNEQNILQGANTAANNANVSQQENINNVNAAVAAGNQNTNLNVLKGVGSGLSSIGGAAGLFAKGGKVLPMHLDHMAKIYHPHLAEGGSVFQPSIPVSSQINEGSAPILPQFQEMTWKGPAQNKPAQKPESTTGLQNYIPAEAPSATGQTDLAAPGPLVDAPEYAYRGGKMMKQGGKVGGKPKVDHDAYKNDTVDAKLSPGEVVIDLDTLKDKGQLGQMARFVAKNIERKKAGRAP